VSENKENIASKFLKWINSPMKLNRWGVLGLILLGAGIAILSVNNVVTINNLLAEKQELVKQHKRMVNLNKSLESQVNDLQSAERITKIAREELGMINSKKAPQILK
jgi:cell division protein FtsL